MVLRSKKVSTSYVQRRLPVGYNKAASLIKRMEREGLISAANATGKREIMVPGRQRAGLSDTPHGGCASKSAGLADKPV